MAHTNSTANYGLPQWIGSDKPTFLGDFNSAFNTIDTQMKSNSITATGAAETASSANATAISANEAALTADGKATLAKNTADAATSAAQSASDLATVAKNTADSAARTARANNIANLAPAYDETRTYSVGELVTYVDENNSGKLYKCVVAWNTPGAFNINYWDDVTTSETYQRKGSVIGSITTDGVMTLEEIFTALGQLPGVQALTEDQFSRCVLRTVTSNHVYYSFPERFKDVDLMFTRLGLHITGGSALGEFVFAIPKNALGECYALEFKIAPQSGSGSTAIFTEINSLTSVQSAGIIWEIDMV